MNNFVKPFAWIWKKKEYAGSSGVYFKDPANYGLGVTDERIEWTPVQKMYDPAPGMAVSALAREIVDALVADEKDGGYDLTAGMFGPSFSNLVRRWAAAELIAQISNQSPLIGEAAKMPGTSGFTMACFDAADVPLGTKLFARCGPGLTNAQRDVLNERSNQIKRGHTIESDDEQNEDDLAALAAVLIMPEGARDWDASSTSYGDTLGKALMPEGWHTNSLQKDRRTQLVRGAALAIAEIERLDRAEANRL